MVFRPVRSRIRLLALGCWLLALQPWRICMKAQPSRTKKAIPYKTANISTSTNASMLPRPISRCGSVYPFKDEMPQGAFFWTARRSRRHLDCLGGNSAGLASSSSIGSTTRMVRDRDEVSAGVPCSGGGAGCVLVGGSGSCFGSGAAKEGLTLVAPGHEPLSR